jgi:hypothetical protein
MRFPWWRSESTRPFTSLQRSRRKHLSRNPLRLAVEQLEDRCVPDANLSALHTPLAFEINQGQANPNVDFLAKGQGYQVYLSSSTAVLALNNGSANDVLWTQLVGANAAPQVVGLDRMDALSNYYLGNDPSKWITNVPNFGRVAYQNVYNGVDLVYHSSDTDQLEYDFVVNPGADPGQIHLNFAGSQGLSLDAQGNLVIQLDGGTVVQRAPVLYQTINGVQTPVSGNFVLEGGTQVGFSVGAYDRSQSLVIDPTLGFSSFLGSTGTDNGKAVAVDATGRFVYIAGSTTATNNNFPSNPNLPGQSGPNDSGAPQNAFVAEFDLTTGKLVFSATMGGAVPLTSFSTATGVALDGTADGLVYVTGSTNAPDFPTSAGAIRTTYSGGAHDAFFSVLDTSAASVNGLNFARTDLGLGAGATSPTALAVGDVNFDGAPDIVAADNGSGSVSVLQNNNTGGFVAPTAAAGTLITGVGTNPNAVVLGNFEGNGFLDALVGSSSGGSVGGLTVLKNNFGASPLYSIDNSFVLPGGINNITAIGMGFNNTNATKLFSIDDVTDGANTPDIAVANGGTGQVDILTLSHAGAVNTFFLQSSIGGFVNPHSLALVDLNNDGHLDLIVVDNTGVYVLQGNGDGTFGATIKVSGDTNVTQVIAENLQGLNGTAIDFNGDGKPDFAFVDSTGKVFVVTNSNGGGALVLANFTVSAGFNVGTSPLSLTAADFNGDSRPDIVAANQGSNNVSVLINTTVGGVLSFANAVPFALPGGAGPKAIVSAQFGQNFGVPDTKFDLAVADFGTNQVSVLDNISAPFYSTYLGGTGDDQANGLVVQNTSATTDNVYIVGNSTSPNQFLTSGAPVNATANKAGAQDAFLARINFNTAGTATFPGFTFAGGTGTDFGNGIALDPATGNPYIVGTTQGGIPGAQLTGSPLQSSFGGGTDAFVVGFTPALAPVYGTYYGGSGTDTGNGVALATLGGNLNIFITGNTSGNLPISAAVANPQSAFQQSFAGTQDAYIANWVVGGANVNYASYIGAATTSGNGIAVDAAGNAYIVGTTNWAPGSFSNTNPNDPLQGVAGSSNPGYNSNNNQGGQDAFLIKVKVGAGASGVGYFDFLGGVQNDLGNAVALAGGFGPANPSIYVVGQTSSSSAALPITNGSTNAGSGDAFLIRLDPLPLPTLTMVSGTLNEGDADQADTVTLTGTGFDARSTVVISTPSGTQTVTPSSPPTATTITIKVPNSTTSPAMPLLREEGTATFTVLGGEGGSTTSMTLPINEVALANATPHANFTGGSALTEGSALSGGGSPPVLVTFTDLQNNGASPPPGSNGEVTVIAGPTTVPTANEYRATVTWGDGSPAQTFTTDGSAADAGFSYNTSTHVFSFAQDHTYAEEGTYTINITLAHGPGFTTTTVVPGITVTVNDAALSGLSVPNVSGNEGGSFTLSGTFTDANPNLDPTDFKSTIGANVGDIVITYKDSSNTVVATDHSNGGPVSVGMSGGKITFSDTRTFAEEGTYTASVSIMDVGGSGPLTTGGSPATITVNEVAMGSVTQHADFTNAAAISEGQSLGAVAPTLLTWQDPAGAELNGTNPAANEYAVQVNWGDGSAVQTFTSDGLGGNGITIAAGTFSFAQNHTYTEEGNDTIQLTLIHGTVSGFTTSQSFSINVTVNDVAPTVSFTHTALTGALSPNEGSTVAPLGVVAKFADSAGLETTADYSATIDWGDGSPTAITTGVISISGGLIVVTDNTGHTYGEEGSATSITVTLKHDPNAPASVQAAPVQTSFAVNIADPQIINVTAATGVNAFGAERGINSGFETLVSFTDPGATSASDMELTSFNFTVNWGDGSPVETLGVSPNLKIVSTGGSPGAFTFAIQGQHTYGAATPPNDGLNAGFIKMTLQHGANPAIVPAPAADCVIGNVPVTPSPGTTFVATEGNMSAVQTVATFTQNGGLDSNKADYTADINWGDGQTTVNATITFSGNTGSVTGSHRYAEEGNYTIKVTIHHSVTGISPPPLDATVNTPASVSDAALTGSGGTTINAVEGAAFGSVVVATFTDANPTAPLSDYVNSTIAWGDGTTSGVTIQASAGGFQVIATKPNAFAEEGNYTYTVTIRDVGGSTTTVTGTVVVADAKLSGNGVSFTGVATIAQTVVVAAFSDADPAGTVTDYSATISWGDGVVTGGTVQAGAGGTFAVLGTHAYGTRGTFTVTITVHDAGGATVVLTSTANISGAPDIIATGADAGGGPEVKVFDAATHALKADFFAFPPTFTGGVRVAVGDVNGDGIPDVVAVAGPGGGPEVIVFDGAHNYQPMAGVFGGFFAMAPTFAGGLYVAVGDVNGDGFGDIIVGAGEGGGPQIAVFSGRDGSQMASFYATTPTFTGGVRVAAGDVEGIKRDDIVATFGPGSASIVEVINFLTLRPVQVLPVFNGLFTGGLYVAAGDVNGDGHADIIVSAGPGGGPEVLVFDGAHNGVIMNAFFANVGSMVNIASPQGLPLTGVRVGTAHIDNKVIITTIGGPGALPLVTDLDGVTLSTLDAFFAYDPSFRFGGFVS